MRRNMSQERTQIGKGFYFYRDGFGFSPGFTGYEVADMLMGSTIFTSTGMPGFVPRNVISWENALFVQDDWHVSPNLTLNLGLRWDVFTPYYEEDDRMANWDPVAQRLVLPDQNGVPRSTIDTDMDNFGPRLGFNYLLSDKTSLRGGYGIFYSLDRGGIDRQLTENPPAVVTEYRFGFDGCIPGSCVSLSDPDSVAHPGRPEPPRLLPQDQASFHSTRSETTRSAAVEPERAAWLFANTSGLIGVCRHAWADNLATMSRRPVLRVMSPAGSAPPWYIGSRVNARCRPPSGEINPNGTLVSWPRTT